MVKEKCPLALKIVCSVIASSTATVGYAYDELGQVTGRAIDGTTTNANNVSTTFDSLGRVTHFTNPLGAFTYAYVNASSRLDTVTFPNGQMTKYSYIDNMGDQYLQRGKQRGQARMALR